MSKVATPLALPVSTVGELLNVPTQTINGWRNDGFLSELGTKGKGRTGARRYSFADVFALAVMRHLTAGPAGLSVPMAANLARSCRKMLLTELAGDAAPGRFLVLVGYGSVMAEEHIARADLPGYVARWQAEQAAGAPRLEIIDVREIALRVLTGVCRLGGQPLAGVGDVTAREQVEATFQERAAAYLRDEIEQFKSDRRS